MSYLPELRASLVRAAERERRAADPKRRDTEPRRRPGHGWLSVAAAAGVAIAVVAVVLIGHRRPAATAPSAPPVPSVQAIHTPAGPPEPNVPAAQAKLMHEAQKSVVAHDPACSASRQLPATIPGSPPASLSSILGVLRRPATAADALPRGTFQSWPPGVYVNAIRRLLSVDGATLYIVPTAGPWLRAVPSRCLREQNAALARELDGSPQHARSCGGNAGALQHGWLGLTGVSGPRGGTVWFTLVPDGVAKVTLDFGGAQRDVTLTVTNNGWGTLQGNLQSLKRTVWRSADGAVIRTIKH